MKSDNEVICHHWSETVVKK